MVPLLALTVVLSAFRYAKAHPSCLADATPPLSVASGALDYRKKNPSLFCSLKVVAAGTKLTLDDGTCCNAERDAQIKATHGADMLMTQFNSSSSCYTRHASLLCSECHPFAQHLYEANPAGFQVALEFNGVLLVNTTFQRQWLAACKAAPTLVNKYYAKPPLPYKLLKPIEGIGSTGVIAFPYDPAWYWGNGGTGNPPPRVFTSLTLPRMIMQLRMRPDTNSWWVVSKEGKIVEFDNDPSVSTLKTVIDISSKVKIGDSEGLFDVSFDPNFADNKVFYATYTYQNNKKANFNPALEFNGIYLRLGRFVLGSTVGATQASEKSVLDILQTLDIHKAGAMAWLNDELYLAHGDGGGENDPYLSAQNESLLLGKIMRMKVDPITAAYQGTGVGGVDNLVIVKGIRNPHKISIDNETKELWWGDVGQSQREEVNLVKTTGLTGIKNMGWPKWEGNRCNLEAKNNRKCGMLLDSDTVPPMFDYCHEYNKNVTIYDAAPCYANYIGSCAIGGFVYRGSMFPALYGHYVYVDYRNAEANVLLLDRDAATGQTTLRERRHLQPLKISVASMAEDKNRELYFVTHKGTDPGMVFALGNCGPLCEVSTTAPTTTPTAAPTAEIIAAPSPGPTAAPSSEPTAAPSSEPTRSPTTPPTG